jgi:hypothetical protein
VRWRPESPEDVQIGFFTEKGSLTVRDLKVWRMGSIWKEYLEQ